MSLALEIGGRVLALVLGAVVAFFFVFAALMGDGGAGERAMTFVFEALAFGVLGLAFGWFLPEVSWRWGLWLAAPTVVLVTWMSFKESEQAWMFALYAVVALAAGCAAAWGGARLKAG